MEAPITISIHPYHLIILLHRIDYIQMSFSEILSLSQWMMPYDKNYLYVHPHLSWCQLSLKSGHIKSLHRLVKHLLSSMTCLQSNPDMFQFNTKTLVPGSGVKANRPAPGFCDSRLLILTLNPPVNELWKCESQYIFLLFFSLSERNILFVLWTFYHIRFVFWVIFIYFNIVDCLRDFCLILLNRSSLKKCDVNDLLNGRQTTPTIIGRIVLC